MKVQNLKKSFCLVVVIGFFVILNFIIFPMAGPIAKNLPANNSESSHQNMTDQNDAGKKSDAIQLQVKKADLPVIGKRVAGAESVSSMNREALKALQKKAKKSVDKTELEKTPALNFEELYYEGALWHREPGEYQFKKAEFVDPFAKIQELKARRAAKGEQEPAIIMRTENLATKQEDSKIPKDKHTSRRTQATMGSELIWYEDFESGFPNSKWNDVSDHDPNNGYDYWDDYGTSQGNQHVYGGSWSCYCADISDVSGDYYDNYMDAYLESDGIDVSGYADVHYKFWIWHDTEPNYDFVYRYYSADGTNWSQGGGSSGQWDGSGEDDYDIGLMNFTTYYTLFVFSSDYSVGPGSYEGAYVDELEIWGSTEPYLAPIYYYVDDDNNDQSRGDGDGIIECNEIIEYLLAIENTGTETATGVYAYWWTDDPAITVTDNYETWPNIAPGTYQWCYADYDFEVAPCEPHYANFYMDIYANESPGYWGTYSWQQWIECELCSLTVTYPNGGENWQCGTTETITWTSAHTSGNVKILYWCDGTWYTITESTPDDGAYNWSIPSQLACDHIKIEVSDVTDGNCYDQSDNLFAIRCAQITVTSPNGGENWQCGTAHNITWTWNGNIANVKIEYLCNGSWTTIVNSTTNDGSHTWNIPSGLNCSQAKIRISDVNNASCNDESDNYFSITCCSITVTSPNGGENWQCGSTHNITWNSSGASSNVKIEYSCNGVWNTIINSTPNDGVHSWTIPANMTCSAARVRITDASNSSCSDQSNGDFSITCPQCNITVTYPNGNEQWTCGLSYNITWTSSGTSGNVKIEYSCNGSWSTIITSTPDDGNFTWTIPNGVQCNQALVRISDVQTSGCTDQSNNYFAINCGGGAIKLEVPNCKVLWGAGTKHKISWTPVNPSGNVRLEYSLNNGVNWNNIITSTPDDGCYDWTTPNSTSENCKVRVSVVGNTSAMDESDVAFSLGTGLTPQLLVTDISGSTGSTVTAEVRIKGNTIPIDAFGFDLNFNTNHLQFIQVDKGELTSQWMQVSGSQSTPGIIKVGGFHTTAIPINSTGTVAKIVFNVTCSGCGECSQSHLMLANMIDDFANMSGYCGVYGFGSACVRGDVNMDGSITPGDALCAFNIYLNNQIPPAGECNTPCALFSADANCDGTVTPGDALIIFEHFLNGTPIHCPTLAKTPGAFSPALSIQNAIGESGEIIRIPIRIDNPKGMAAFGMDLRYPANLLQFAGVERTGLTQDWLELNGQESETGIIRLGGFHTTAIAKDQSDVLAEVIFMVKDNVQGEGGFEVLEVTDDLAEASILTGRFRASVTSEGPAAFRLAQNNPNPFNLETEIHFEIPYATQVQVTVYNISGQAIKTLMDAPLNAGAHKVKWDGKDAHGRDLTSGIYICKLEAGNQLQTCKMTLIK